MSSAIPCLPFTAPAIAPPIARVWRPFPREIVDIVALEHFADDVRQRMHPCFGISLVRSPAVVTVESKRDVITDRHSVVLVPPFHLHQLLPQGAPSAGVVTLLVRGSELDGLGLPAEAALATDPALGKQLATLIDRSLAPVASVEDATTMRSVLEQLLACRVPLVPTRARRAARLDPVRTHLQTNTSELVPIADVARISGLCEHEAIRAFHYQFGLPPHAYHTCVRLAAACELLTRGLPVARVALECGFADQSHMSRRFKAIYGVSPATWATASAAGRGQGTRVRRAAVQCDVQPAVRDRDDGRGRARAG